MKKITFREKTVTIIALAVLSLAVIGLGIYSCVLTANAGDMETQMHAEHTAMYEELTTRSDDVQTLLTKLSVCGDDALTRDLLTEAYRETAQLSGLLETLSLDGDHKYDLTNFVNTSMDYLHALSLKTTQGSAFSEADHAQIQEINQRFSKFHAILSSADMDGDLATDIFADEQNQEFLNEEFPRLIYDGPFSESIMNKAPVGLSGYHVTEQQALSAAMDFAGCALSPIAHADSEILPFYNFSGEHQGETITVSVTKQGGAILSYFRESQTDGLSMIPSLRVQRQVEKVAAAFLKEKDYGEFSPSYAIYYNGCAVINMVPLDGNTLLYPDIIKIWVNLSNKTVCGLDARNYLMCHQVRTYPEILLSAEDAQAKLSPVLTVNASNLALIPKDDGTEALCHEFACTYNEQDILVYINAETGAYEDILIIIHDSNGTLTQ